MPFERIRVNAFRNLIDTEISTDAERIFLVGENGQGKTNFLEALYYLSYGVSFRGPVDAEAAKGNGGSFSLFGKIRRRVSTGPEDEIIVSWERNKKDIRLNGKHVSDRKELIAINPSIVFCHEDFAFASGEPERRRLFFDQSASLISLEYIEQLRKYKRILKQRNTAIKTRQIDVFPLLDFQLASTGLELRTERNRLRDELCARFSQRYEAVSLLGTTVEIMYRPSWPNNIDADGILERLEAIRPEEIARGTSLSGPHRDRWWFSAGGKEFSSTASTGQLRLLSLTLRMVQAEYYTAVTNRAPVLLLDDVLLELDRGKRRRFLDLLPASGQSFFTFLPGEDWEDYRTDSTLIYEVRDGRFEI